MFVCVVVGFFYDQFPPLRWIGGQQGGGWVGFSHTYLLPRFFSHRYPPLPPCQGRDGPAVPPPSVGRSRVFQIDQALVELALGRARARRGGRGLAGLHCGFGYVFDLRARGATVGPIGQFSHCGLRVGVGVGVGGGVRGDEGQVVPLDGALR